MRKLIDVPNTDTPTTDYPKGKVRDKAGAIAGTTGGEVLFGDITQFFQKLVIDAAITENDLADNVANGYQLIDALLNKIRNRYNVISIDADYTINPTDDFIIADTTSNDVNLTLPTPSSFVGREIIIRNFTGANTLNYTGEIDSSTLADSNGGFGNQLRLISNGTTWNIANLPYNGI